MKLSTVKEIFDAKLAIAGGLKPPDDTLLSNIAHEALIYVATKCKPRELVRDSVVDAGEPVLRLVAGGEYIAIPEKPDFTSDVHHLQIDEDLNYAVISKMVAIYSKNMDEINKFEQECTRIINIYKANYTKFMERESCL